MKPKTTTNFLDEVKDEIDKLSEQNIRTSVSFTAKSLASQNLPLEDEQEIEPFLTFKGEYLALKHEVKTKVQGGLQVLLGKINVSTINESIGRKKDEIELERRQIRNLQIDVSKIPNHGVISNFWPILWLILIGAGECIPNIPGFLQLGDVFILAILLSLILGVSQMICAKAITLGIREIACPKTRRRYYILEFVGSFIYSVILGLFRYKYVIDNGGDAASLFVNPLTFAVMNMVLITAAIMVTYYYLPTKKEVRTKNAVVHLESRIEKSKAKASKLEKELQKLNEERAEIISIHSELIEGQKHLLGVVDSYYDSAVGLFKTENVARRTDGVYPPCFRVRHEPLPHIEDTVFNFSTLKSQSNETNR